MGAAGSATSCGAGVATGSMVTGAECISPVALTVVMSRAGSSGVSAAWRLTTDCSGAGVMECVALKAASWWSSRIGEGCRTATSGSASASTNSSSTSASTTSSSITGGALWRNSLGATGSDTVRDGGLGGLVLGGLGGDLRNDGSSGDRLRMSGCYRWWCGLLITEVRA